MFDTVKERVLWFRINKGLPFSDLDCIWSSKEMYHNECISVLSCATTEDAASLRVCSSLSKCSTIKNTPQCFLKLKVSCKWANVLYTHPTWCPHWIKMKMRLKNVTYTTETFCMSTAVDVKYPLMISVIKFFIYHWAPIYKEPYNYQPINWWLGIPVLISDNAVKFTRIKITCIEDAIF